VLGIEGEGFWSGLKTQDNENETSGDESDGYFENYTTKNKWDADIAARFGVAFDRALVYSKAGVVWGRFSFSGTYGYEGISYYQYSAPDTTITGTFGSVARSPHRG